MLKQIQTLALLFLGQGALAADLPEPIIIGKETINDWLISIGNFLIQAGIILGIIMIVYSGIRWMMSGGDASGAGDARKILQSSVIGIAVILAVGLIIKTVTSLITGSFFG